MPREGAVIGERYRLGAAIGEGGHGTVFRATDVRVGRSVAVKLLHEGRGGGDGVEARFEQEATLARTLQHPNTVRLLDMGRTDEGALFIVYELLHGSTLSEVLRTAGALSETRVRRVGMQVLKALMEAHSCGFVHRDIKPSNIFLCQVHGDADFVKVIDFGIAKAIEVGHSITRTGFVVGTPSYMAPEQVRGEAVTAATDVYALGLVLAEALTGKVLVTGATDAVIAALQLALEPVTLPPSVLQSSLGPIIHRATQKAVERRYPSAQAMLDGLLELGPASGASIAAAPTFAGTIESRAPTGARPAPRQSDVRPKGRRSGSLGVGLLALASVLLVGVAAAVIALAATAQPTTKERSEVPSPKKRRSTNDSEPVTPDPAPAPPAPSLPPALPASAKPIAAGVLGNMDRAGITNRLAAVAFEVTKRDDLKARIVFEGTWFGRVVTVIYLDGIGISNHQQAFRGPHVAFHEEQKNFNTFSHGLFVICEADPPVARILLGELLAEP